MRVYVRSCIIVKKTHLQHDSLESGLGHVSVGGDAGLLGHHLLGFGVSLPFKDVVDAHVHERSHVEVAEGRAKDGRVFEEESRARGICNRVLLMCQCKLKTTIFI